MEFLLSAGHSFAAVSREAPEHYTSYRIRAAAARYFKNGFGDFFIQILPGKGFRIQLSIFHILKKKCLYPYTSRPVITLHFMMKGNVRCFLHGFGEARLREGLYHLFYTPGKVKHRAWFERGEYHSFHIDLSPQYLRRLAAKYPEVKEALDRWRHHSASGLQQHAAHITREVVHLIDELKRCPEKEEPDKSLYLEARILELLRLYVRDRPVGKISLSRHDVRLMQDITAYITAHLDYPHTIHSLAGRYAMSETSLRRLIKQYTGQSFRHFLLDTRMKTAILLLSDNTLTIQDIAMQIGYQEFSNFDRAFYKKFGITPHHYRLQNKNMDGNDKKINTGNDK
jgi:AraC-like DNA-binding protein